jgi:hypothetical protein
MTRRNEEVRFWNSGTVRSIGLTGNRTVSVCEAHQSRAGSRACTAECKKVASNSNSGGHQPGTQRQGHNLKGLGCPAIALWHGIRTALQTSGPCPTNDVHGHAPVHRHHNAGHHVLRQHGQHLPKVQAVVHAPPCIDVLVRLVLQLTRQVEGVEVVVNGARLLAQPLLRLVEVKDLHAGLPIRQ